MVVFLEHAWNVTSSLAPWLLLGTVVAGVLHVFLPPDFVSRHLGGGRLSDVLKATLLGVPMPLCSCAVIPAAVGLKKDGASDGASIGFLISTPQTGVDSIAVSAAFLGWPFALFKVVSAFLTGLIGGGIANIAGDGNTQVTPGTDACFEPPSEGARPTFRRLREVVHFAFGDLLYGIWKWLVIGIALSALISAFIPAGTLSDKAWATGWVGMLAMLAISLPLYVCATGSVPIAAALVAAGMSPGAALVFLMAGPATNVATLGAVYKTFGKRILAVYLGVLVAGSLLLGGLFDFVLAGPAGAHGGQTLAATHGTTSVLTSVSAGALILLLFWYALSDVRRRWPRESGLASAGGEPLTLTVTGMSCQNCVKHVTQALAQLASVRGVDVDLASGAVTVHGDGLEHAVLARTVEEAGYAVSG